jgi:glycosyltransferase involved in cell wall biosynthesis
MKHELAKICKKHILFGLSAHSIFPKNRPDVVELCRGWIHCFRNPDEYLGTEIPRILLHESDFTDEKFFRSQGQAKVYDVVYSCKRGKNQQRYKNFKLFKRCLPILVGEMGLKIAVIGSRPKIPPAFKKSVHCIGPVQPKPMRDIIDRSRIAFFPNILDAGPRVITESLCMNVPVVVNENILGGWKYVNDQTGAFFTSPEDVKKAFAKVLKSNLHPRKWYTANYGRKKSGKILYDFVQSIAPKATKAKYYQLSLQ